MSRRAETDIGSGTGRSFVVDREACIGCGVSTSVAPGLINLVDGTAVVVKQPQTSQDVAALENAVAFCPVGAISEVRTSSDQGE